MNIFSKLVNGIKKIDTFLESFFTDILKSKRDFDKKEREMHQNIINYFRKSIWGYKKEEPNKPTYLSKQLTKEELCNYENLNKAYEYGHQKPKAKEFRIKIKNSRYELIFTPDYIHIHDPSISNISESSELACSWRNSGWKFHFNIDKNTLAINDEWWDKISETLLDEKNGVGYLKIVNKFYGAMYNSKQVTIYVYENTKTKELEKPLKEYEALFSKIENILTQLKIKPTKKPPLDRATLNGTYTTYRNEKSKSGKYVPNEQNESENLTGETEKNYNPGGHSDPFEDMKIDRENNKKTNFMFPTPKVQPKDASGKHCQPT